MTAADLFHGGGECGALIRSLDWPATALGDAASWPASLKALVRTLLNTRQPMLLWWGPQLVQVYNDAFRPSFGEGKHPKAMGQPARECWPEVWPIVGQQLENVVAKGDAIWNEETLVPVFRNGKVDDAWWTYSYSPVFDDDGERAGVLIVCTETTAAIVARRELERASKEAEIAREELRSVFMQAPIPIAILTGPEHRFTLSNPAYEALVGRKVLGKTLMEAFTEEESADYRGFLDQVFRTGEPVSLRESALRLANAQGVVEDRYIDFIYHAYRSPDGAILGVMALVNDVTAAVTARKEIERAVQERRKLAEAIEQSNEFIGIATPDGTGVYLNRAGRSLVGLDAGEPIQGRRLLDFFAPDRRRQVQDVVLPALARHGRWEGELAFENFVTGERIPVWYSIFEVRDPGGEVIALGTVTRDIRAQKALEGERLAMLEREQTLRVAAEAAGRARDQFLAMLGHELRNPLAPISTATTLMRMNGDRHARERQIIERQVAHLSRLVDDLLDVSRIARGKISLSLAPIELAEVVSKAIEMASPLLEQHAHQLSVNVPRTGLIVEGDAVRLSQVLENLLSNAAKYTQPGGRISIDAWRTGGTATVTVADNGPGIAEELLPRVFDLFVQGHQRIDRAQGGLGLGLALVKNLVALHGGTVSARNLPGGGSAFSISLPAIDGETATTLQARKAEAPAISSANVRRRVLVVDDNEDAADLLSDFLRGVGHEVAIAHDGPQALEMLRSFPAEIGLLDLGLPGMDGFELARRIREQRGSSVRHLVALTGYGQERDRDASRSAGFDRHLTKPVDLEDLAAIIEEGS
jgi:PAS domain S-box-containing protein